MSNLTYLVVNENFVNPNLCKTLKDLGFSPDTKWWWRVKQFNADLHTDMFDLDDYYKKVYDVTMPFDQDRFAALQLAEIQAILPDYCLSKTNGRYSLCCDALYGLDEVTGSCLADVFANMAIQCLKKRVITPECAKQTLLKKIKL